MRRILIVEELNAAALAQAEQEGIPEVVVGVPPALAHLDLTPPCVYEEPGPPEPDPIQTERAEVRQLLEDRIALYPRLLATRADAAEVTDLQDEIEYITQYLRDLEE